MTLIETTRTQTTLRFRKARSDSTIRKLAAAIEAVRGLPVGSVRIVAPSGRKMRDDASVAALRARWGE